MNGYVRSSISSPGSWLVLCSWRVAAITLTFGAVLSASAQTLVIVEASVDAGPVRKGAIIKKDFVVRNSGTSDLKILDVKPKCSCMTAVFDKTIGPGAEGRISVAIDTKGFGGSIWKAADVLSNDPERSSFEIGVTADVKALVSVRKPGYLRLEVEPGVASTGSVSIDSDAPTFKPRIVGSPRKSYLRSSITQGSSPGEWVVTLTCDETAPEGLLREDVRVQTGVPEQPEVVITVTGVVGEKGAATEPAPRAASAGGPRMTNKDVVDLVAGGLSEGVVVNSVKQAGGVDFDLTLVGLLALKKAKVPDGVIMAMQEKAGAAQTPAPIAVREDPSPTPGPSNGCAGIENMGLYKNEIFSRAMGGGVVEWLAKIRNNTGVTKIVVFSWRDQYGQRQSAQVQIRGGDIVSPRVDMSQAKFIAPVKELELVSCR